MPELIRTLRLRDLVLLIIGAVIGSGIFLVPAGILNQVDHSVITAALVWIFGGILCLLGALTYGELAAMKPEAGGLYVYEPAPAPGVRAPAAPDRVAAGRRQRFGFSFGRGIQHISGSGDSAGTLGRQARCYSGDCRRDRSQRLGYAPKLRLAELDHARQDSPHSRHQRNFACPRPRIFRNPRFFVVGPSLGISAFKFWAGDDYCFVGIRGMAILHLQRR